ncbi:MAG: hypothetical protein ACJ760_00535 [Thermoleophilaceae bacterium]
MSTLFCRHNRFTADCPICSKGTVLDADRAAGRRPRPKPAGGGGARRQRSDPGAARQFSGPHVTAGPYEREDGGRYEVRLERVPGGVRLAEWSGGRLERRAPELPATGLAELVTAALVDKLLPARDAAALGEALRTEPDGDGGHAASPGRSGDLREELRVEPLDGGRVRVGRWLLYPSRGWELQDAPPMMPAARYAEALAAAARLGLVGAAPR